jgi:hypothetical protein
MQPLTVLKTIVLSTMASLIVFLIIEVAFAQVIGDTIVTALDGSAALIPILWLGFGLVTVVGVSVGLLVTDTRKDRWGSFYAAVLALVSNIALWVIIAYLSVIQTFPTIIPAPDPAPLLIELIARGFNYLIAIPRILGTYAIYLLGNPVDLWFYSLFTYQGLFGVFLYSLSK